MMEFGGGGALAVGFHSLPQELLPGIFGGLQHEPERGPQHSQLLALRTVSRALRDAVDAAVTRSGFRVTAHNVHNVALRDRVLGILRARLPRWPNLVELRILFDWESGSLQLALQAVVQVCPCLSTLNLEAAHKTMVTEGNAQLCLSPLEALPTLTHLSLTGFLVFARWSEGLSRLSSLTKLVLKDHGPVILEPPPHLQELEIQRVHARSLVGPLHLAWGTRLRRLVLHDQIVESLPPAGSCASLEELELVEVRVRISVPGAFNRFLGGLSRLRVLQLYAVDGEFEEELSLVGCTALTSVTLSRLLDGPQTRLQGLGKLTALKELTLKQIQVREISDLTPRCLPCLLNLRLISVHFLRQLPPLAAFPNLKELVLLGLDRVVTARVTAQDPAVLTSLEKLVVRDCPVLELPQACLSSLRKLKSLHYGYLKAAQMAMLFPNPAVVPDLRRLGITACCGSCAGLRELRCLSKLQDLELGAIEGLQELPQGLHALTSLQLVDCHQLKTVNLKGLGSLKVLLLMGLESVASLPELGHLVALERLEIDGLPLLRALERFSCLHTLKSVNISRCPLTIEEDLQEARQLCTLKVVDAT